MNRTNEIKKVSFISIAANIVLVAFKAAVGFISGSIAIMLDAVNNLADALTSGITILGVVLAGKKPDNKHPFGYGRIEYISAVVISGLVLFAGISSAVESAKRIADPEPADYSLVTIIIVSAAIVAKYLLGSYQKKKGKSLGSDSLLASGAESQGDCAISASTLVAIAVSAIWGISIEGYIGVVIAALIIKAGVELLMNSLSNILGKRAQGELAADIKREVAQVPGVLGVYDLVLHDYGPDSAMGSVHIEIDDNESASEIHKIIKHVQAAVMKQFHILLTVGIYASNTSNPKIIELRDYVSGVAMAQKGVLGLHAFFWEGKEISFDIVVDFNCDIKSAVQVITGAICERIEGADVHITIDKNYTD